MNWTSDFNAGLALQNNGGFLDSNFQFQCSSDIPIHHSQESDLTQQRKKDENFLNDFILGKQQNQKKSLVTNKIKISDAKSLLLEIINDKKRIEKEIFKLNVNDENFDSKWEMSISNLNKINERISKFNLEIKMPLAMALKKRLKKRKAIKKRREKLITHKKLNREKINQQHKIIDKLLSEKSEEVEVIKYEAGLKRQADTVLHEVRKKKYEAKKIINLLVALTKLRELRSKQEENLGGYCSKSLSETFFKVMTRFQNLWKKQLEVYKLEEKGLKIMLEENTVPHKKDSKFETNILLWDKVLFGDITNDKNEQILTMPERDLQALIQVRREWDQFLTIESAPMATSIPPGWVLPPVTENELWKAFIKTSRKIPLT